MASRTGLYIAGGGALVLTAALTLWSPAKHPEQTARQLTSDESAKLAAALERQAGKQQTASAAECLKNRANYLKDINARIKAGDISVALYKADICASTGDAEFKELFNTILAASLGPVVANSKLTLDERIEAANRLVGLNDKLSAKYGPVARRLEAQRDKQRGVTIGMTSSQVLASSWGKPERVNVRITAKGRQEQWCYPGGQYLYIDDGVLTSISTTQ